MKNQNIIITGGATRIGAEIAKNLADENVKITIHYNRSSTKAKALKKVLEKKGSKVFLAKGNLTKTKDLKKIIYFAKKNMKRIDCLINNASLFENDNVNNFTNKSWENHLNTNLRAPAFLSKEFAKLISKKSNGCIINIIDQRIFKPTPHFFSYTLSKIGLQTLTKLTAMGLAPNIRVNGIAPGPTLKNIRQSKKNFKKQYLSTLLKKQVDTEEICSAVKFFIENKSVTGQIIAIDSGQSLNWKTTDIVEIKE